MFLIFKLIILIFISNSRYLSKELIITMSGNMYKSHHLSCYKTDFLNTQNVYLKKFSYTFCNNNFLLSLHLKILICYLQSNGYVYVIVIFFI